MANHCGDAIRFYGLKTVVVHFVAENIIEGFLCLGAGTVNTNDVQSGASKRVLSSPIGYVTTVYFRHSCTPKNRYRACEINIELKLLRKRARTPVVPLRRGTVESFDTIALPVTRVRVCTAFCENLAFRNTRPRTPERDRSSKETKTHGRHVFQ